MESQSIQFGKKSFQLACKRTRLSARNPLSRSLSSSGLHRKKKPTESVTGSHFRPGKPAKPRRRHVLGRVRLHARLVLQQLRRAPEPNAKASIDFAMPDLPYPRVAWRLDAKFEAQVRGLCGGLSRFS